jgi:hypothetical protein
MLDHVDARASPGRDYGRKLESRRPGSDRIWRIEGYSSRSWYVMYNMRCIHEYRQSDIVVVVVIIAIVRRMIDVS